MNRIIAFDPGESTGWAYIDENGTLTGGTLRGHLQVAEIIDIMRPDIIVFETFHLYPSMAKLLSWNSFYPCEIIGVIRYVGLNKSLPIVEQAPSIKKYAGPVETEWFQLKIGNSKLCLPFDNPVTEHTKDAYMHLKYYMRRNKLK